MVNENKGFSFIAILLRHYFTQNIPVIQSEISNRFIHAPNPEQVQISCMFQAGVICACRQHTVCCVKCPTFKKAKKGVSLKTDEFQGVMAWHRICIYGKNEPGYKNKVKLTEYEKKNNLFTLRDILFLDNRNCGGCPVHYKHDAGIAACYKSSGSGTDQEITCH
jgi:hypothetical protein